MSNSPIEVVRVQSVHKHPQADRLEIVKVLNTQFISSLGDYKEDDLCIYLPPDTLVPQVVAERHGFATHLKPAIFPGDLARTKCRVSAIKLRGIPSYGLGLPINTVHWQDGFLETGSPTEGCNLMAAFEAAHWQPVEKFTGGDNIVAPCEFHEYTDIEGYYKYASEIPEGMPVRITEKLHGSSARIGCINGTLYCGSHHRVKAEYDLAGKRSLYWLPESLSTRRLLAYLGGNAILFGEIFGKGVQFMDYGTDKTFRVFDISVNGRYLDWRDVVNACEQFWVPTVPLLFEGEFRRELIDVLVDGPTTLAPPDKIGCKFKGREGIVITPLKEQFNSIIGRTILKAVSADYHAAK